MDNERTVEILNDLLTRAYDAEQGFAKAAERAEHHGGLIAFFNRQSEMRRAFGHELKQAIERYGGEPDKGASMAAKAHQIWITVRDSLSSDKSEEAVLEECIRGEEVALNEYDEALSNPDLPADVRDIIASQRGQVANVLADIKAKEAAAS